MSYSFPSSAPKVAGYDKQQVDKFVELARVQFADSNLELVTANVVRNTEFDLVSGGYLVSAVDTAMDRLEDAFAEREIQRQKRLRGEFAVDDRLERVIEIVKARTARPKKKKIRQRGMVASRL